MCPLTADREGSRFDILIDIAPDWRIPDALWE